MENIDMVNIYGIDMLLDIDKVKQFCSLYKKNEFKNGYDCTAGVGIGGDCSLCTPRNCAKYKEVETRYKLALAEAKLRFVESICEEAIRTYATDSFYEDDVNFFMGQSGLAEEILDGMEVIQINELK